MFFNHGVKEVSDHIGEIDDAFLKSKGSLN